MNRLDKSFNADEFTDKSLTLFKLLVNKFKSMHSFLEFDESYKLNNLIEEFKSNVIHPSIEDISTVIVEELELLDEYIKQAKKIEDEQITHKNEINLKYMTDKDGRNKIFGDYFVDYNIHYLSLIINGKKFPLTNEYNLKKGENNVTICIEHDLKILSHMFYDCKTLYNIKELKYLNTENVTDFSHMFAKTEISDITPLKNWNTSNAKNMSSMFDSCELLTNLKGLENWNVSNCKDFSYIFHDCTNLSNVKALGNWNLLNATNLSGFFENCKNLTDINFAKNWNVSKCQNFSMMFRLCEKLKDIKPLQNLDVSKGDNFSDMFYINYSSNDSLKNNNIFKNWKFKKEEYFKSMFGYYINN